MKMATDLKLEIFAYNIFQTVFQSHKLIQFKPNIFEIYGNECLGDPSYAEVYDDLFHKAIFCRRELFQIVYKGEIMCEKIESFRSPVDLFDYLIKRCDQDYLFHNLSVFERMFATCAFVASMCVHIYWYNVVDVTSYGHLFWARFFEKYTKEFYREGGWNQLKQVAKTYDLLYEFLALFPENFDNYFRAIKEASVNYRLFKEVAVSKKNKHVSKMWVKFRIANLKNYVKIPVSYEVFLNPIKTEFLLEELKQLCDPRPEEALEYQQFRDGGSKLNCFNEFLSTTDDSESDMSPERHQVKRVNEFLSRTDNSWNSEEDSDSDDISQGSSQVKSDNEFVLYTDVSSSSVDDSDSDDIFQERYRGRHFSAGMVSEICTEIKTKDNYLRIQPFLLSLKNSSKISNSSFENDKKLQREEFSLISFEDVFHHLHKNKILEPEEKTLSANSSEFGLNRYLVNRHNISAVESTSQPFEPITEKSSGIKSLDYFIANCNRNHDSLNEIGTTNLNSRNITFQREVNNVVEGTHIIGNQMVKSVWEAKSLPKNIRTPKELNLQNERINIDGEGENTEKFGNAYSDSRNKGINETVKTMGIFTNLMTTSEWNAETSPEIFPNLEDSDLVNGNVSSGDGEESIKTRGECFDSRKRETNETINSMVATKRHKKTSTNIAHTSNVSNDSKVRSEDERKIVRRKLDAPRNELDDSSLNQFSRTFFKLEDMEAVGCIRVTSFTKEERLENSSESFKNSKKRTRKEHEASRKKYSPERKEIEN